MTPASGSRLCVPAWTPAAKPVRLSSMTPSVDKSKSAR